MNPGTRYKVQYRSEIQRRSRIMVMDYLGEDEHAYIFSARPIAGTQTLPKAWMENAIEVPKTTPITIEKLA